MLLLFRSIKIIQFGLPYESRCIFFGKSIYCTYGLSNIIVTFSLFFGSLLSFLWSVVYRRHCLRCWSYFYAHTIVLWVFLEFDIIVRKQVEPKKGAHSKEWKRNELYENSM